MKITWHKVIKIVNSKIKITTKIKIIKIKNKILVKNKIMINYKIMIVNTKMLIIVTKIIIITFNNRRFLIALNVEIQKKKQLISKLYFI